MGELAKEIRRKKGEYIAEDSDSKGNEELAHEFSDVLTYLVELANLCDVNLEGALRSKMEKNRKRTWNKASGE